MSMSESLLLASCFSRHVIGFTFSFKRFLCFVLYVVVVVVVVAAAVVSGAPRPTATALSIVLFRSSPPSLLVLQGAERKTRDEERRAAKRKMTATGRKKLDELYHPAAERSEFYCMADLHKPPVLFTPSEEVSPDLVQTWSRLQGPAPQYGRFI